MSGHNKWSTIKNRKGAQDQRKSKAFFEASKLIRAAVKQSGNGDANTNPALRLALDKARSVNMPKENVQRAIDRGLGKTAAGQQLHEIVYEGYGPHGSGFIVLAITDNVQRTAGNIRFLFTRHGGSLGGPGSAMYLFERAGGDYTVKIPLDLPADQIGEVSEFYDALMSDDDVEEAWTNVPLPEEDDAEA